MQPYKYSSTRRTSERRIYGDRKNYIIPVIRNKDDVELETICFEQPSEQIISAMEQQGKDLAYFIYNFTPSVFYSGVIECLQEYRDGIFDIPISTYDEPNDLKLSIKNRKMILD